MFFWGEKKAPAGTWVVAPGFYSIKWAKTFQKGSAAWAKPLNKHVLAGVLDCQTGQAWLVGLVRRARQAETTLLRSLSLGCFTAYPSYHLRSLHGPSWLPPGPGLQYLNHLLVQFQQIIKHTQIMRTYFAVENVPIMCRAQKCANNVNIMCRSCQPQDVNINAKAMQLTCTASLDQNGICVNVQVVMQHMVHTSCAPIICREVIYISKCHNKVFLSSVLGHMCLTHLNKWG